MKRIGIQAHPKQNTSRAHPQNRVYPTFCGAWRRADQPGLGDGHDRIPMARGFVRLSVVMDWANRKVLAWRLSNTMTPDAPVAENVYLHAYVTVSDAKAGIGRYLCFFNEKRPHSALDGQVPDTVYFASMPPMAEAA